MKSSINHGGIDEKEPSEGLHDSTWKKPNLKEDWLNLFLLILLYTMQGLPIGLSLSFPMILQSKQMITYDEQVSKYFILHLIF